MQIVTSCAKIESVDIDKMEEAMMQFKRNNRNEKIKKIMSIALATFMLASGISSSLVFADENSENVILSEETIMDASSSQEDSQLQSEEASDATPADNSEIPNDSSLDSLDIIVEDKAIKTSSRKLNGFVREDGKWRFYVNNIQSKGWIKYQGIDYYIINGYSLPQNMWRTIKGNRYYFNKDGVMIRDQKVKIDGKEYQFNRQGHMVANDNSKRLNEVTPEQQAIYNKGAQILRDSEKNSSFVKNGIFKEAGKWFKYVDGRKARGWYQDGANRLFFLNTFSRAENMWRTIDGVRYYFDSNGAMVSNTIRYIDGSTYKFEANGALNKSVKTTVIQRDIDIRVNADNKSAIVGKFIKGNGVEIVSTNGSYSKVKNGNGKIEGWIPSSAYISESQKRIENVISVAKSKLGAPYVWGATGPSTFDCSGLMLYSFSRGANVNLPRVSRYQARVGRYVSREQLRPGDMVFWGSPVHHVGLYIGNGKYIHAPEPGSSVRIAQLGSYTTARRVIE